MITDNKWKLYKILQKHGYVYRDYWKNDDGSFTYIIDADPVREKFSVESTDYEKFKKIMLKEFPGSSFNSSKFTMK